MPRMFEVWRHAFRPALVAASAAMAFSAAAAAAPPPAYSSLYVFGDSLSDAGNVSLYSPQALPFTVPNPTAYFAGHFSNGPNHADVLAQNLGLASPLVLAPGSLGLNPSLVGGTNFAWGGAGTGLSVLPPTGLQVPPIFRATLPGPGELPSQLQMFYQATGGAADPQALYVLWGGANDLRDAMLYTRDHPALALTTGEQVISAAISNLQGSLATLAAMGAQHVLVPNLPDLGLTPESHEWSTDPAFSIPAYATALSGNFNVRLDAMLDAFQGSAVNLDIMPFDTYALFNDIVADPARYGFTDTTHACLSGTDTIYFGGTACSTPSQFVYWDNKHPGAAVSAILGQRMALLTAAPEPRTYALLLAGLLWLAWRARQRV